VVRGGIGRWSAKEDDCRQITRTVRFTSLLLIPSSHAREEVGRVDRAPARSSGVPAPQPFDVELSAGGSRTLNVYIVFELELPSSLLFRPGKKKRKKDGEGGGKKGEKQEKRKAGTTCLMV